MAPVSIFLRTERLGELLPIDLDMEALAESEEEISLGLETIADIPTTAHILGGAVIGADAERGVVDRNNRVFGYQNLIVCDGAAMPANPGVNPSLTITALAEHAMSKIPDKGAAA
jgi:choline dehydrogenase-like flavoprotein